MWIFLVDVQIQSNPLLKLKIRRTTRTNYKIEHSDDEDFSESESEFAPSSSCSSTSSSSSSDSRNTRNANPSANPLTKSLENTSPKPKTKKGKKRIRKPENWKKNQRKCLRNAGQQYTSARGKLVKAREMGPVCKCRLNCSINISEKLRKKFFDEYWALGSLQRQRDYLSSCIDVVKVSYRRIKENVELPRKPNCAFYFLQDGKRVKVCKPFLINTLGLKERTLRSVIDTKFSGIGASPNDMRGKHKHHSKLSEEIEESVRIHINSIPRIESHYLRAQTSREFIDGGLTIAEMHRNYVSERNLISKPSANYDAYFRIFNTQFNIGFHVPKKDQCDQCVSFNNLNEDEKLTQEESYKSHQEEKELSRQEKAKDIENSKKEGNQIVAIYDLQAVMPVPIGNSSAFFYHSKLNCYNFTVS